MFVQLFLTFACCRSIWVTNRNEPLKATAASTLARLLRYNPGLLRFLLDKYGIRHLVAGALTSFSSLAYTVTL